MWCARLGKRERQALLLLIEGQGEVGPELKSARDQLELARWENIPDAPLPWSQVEQLASAQGVSEADVVWDMAGSHEEPAAPRPRPRRRRRRRPKKATGPRQA